MRAVGYQTPLAIDNPASLQDIDLPKPVPSGRDLLVEIRAVSVNPVDTKVRRSVTPDAGQWRVLGWDAAGFVVGTGPEVTDFAIGDEVFYAGALDRLDIRRSIPGVKPTVLIIGGAGGVSSIAIQLARVLTDVTVIATASRPETRDWVKSLGAHHVVDHSRPLAAQVAPLPTGAPGFVFSTTQTDRHMPEIVALIAPQGHFGLIDDPAALDALPLKKKSLSLHWELMFTRPLFGTADMGRQGEILNDVSRLVDDGRIRTTLGRNLGLITAANLRQAHALIESGQAKGKIVLEGFPD